MHLCYKLLGLDSKACENQSEGADLEGPNKDTAA